MRKEPFSQKRTVPFGGTTETVNNVMPTGAGTSETPDNVMPRVWGCQKRQTKSCPGVWGCQKRQTMSSPQSLADIVTQQVNCFFWFVRPGEKNGLFLSCRGVFVTKDCYF